MTPAAPDPGAGAPPPRRPPRGHPFGIYAYALMVGWVGLLLLTMAACSRTLDQAARHWVLWLPVPVFAWLGLRSLRGGSRRDRGRGLIAIAVAIVAVVLAAISRFM